MKIYIASRYGRMTEMQAVADILRGAGHEVTSRWVAGAEETLTESSDGALMDVEDIDRADAVLSFSEDYGTLNKGGGRHWEMGYAYARGKILFLIGSKEIIFHHLPTILPCDSVGGLLKLVATADL